MWDFKFAIYNQPCKAMLCIGATLALGSILHVPRHTAQQCKYSVHHLTDAAKFLSIQSYGVRSR